MNWTEPKPPTKDVSYYDHTTCKTPLGTCIIEWKSWKQDPDYSVQIGDNYIGTEYSLDDAKQLAVDYLINIRNVLNDFLR